MRTLDNRVSHTLLLIQEITWAGCTEGLEKGVVFMPD